MAYPSSKLQIGMDFDKRFLWENPQFHLPRFADSRLAVSPNPLGERPCFVWDAIAESSSEQAFLLIKRFEASSPRDPSEANPFIKFCGSTNFFPNG
jgi:hypothetical protein